MLRYAMACIGLWVALELAPTPSDKPQHLLDVKLQHPEDLKMQLSSFLKYRTIGAASAPLHVPAETRHEFHQAAQFLESTYAAAYRKAKVTKIAEHSLLMEFEGSDPSLKPFALLSHYDVVPADANVWTFPPFSGAVYNGYIWGRGALDLKGNVIAILHAVNQLAASGTFKPRRGLVIAFGHDEEVGGSEGAAQIVKYLQRQGVMLEFVLDEGGFIIQDGLPPLTKTPLALIGTAEKDYSLLRVNVTSEGGHSSMPPVDGSSVASIVSRLLTRLEAHPAALRLQVVSRYETDTHWTAPAVSQSPTTDFVRALAAALPTRTLRWVLHLADYWPIGQVIARLMSRSPSTNAMVATTSAITTLQAGGTNNVLPQTGGIIINVRHLPGHTPQQAKAHVERLVPEKDRDQVTVEIVEARKPGHVSPAQSPSFDLIERVIHQTRWPNSKDSIGSKLLVAPYLVVGGTDAKHYEPLSSNIYRFQPVPVNRTGGDISRIHGTDERIHIDDLEASCRFFMQLVYVASSSSDLNADIIEQISL